MLNAAWDAGKMVEWYVNTPRSIYPKRWRDVSRIIKELIDWTDSTPRTQKPIAAGILKELAAKNKEPKEKP